MSLFLRFRKYVLKIIVEEEYRGIFLIPCSLSEVKDKNFIEYAKQALLLIEQTDPRRFRRVQAEVSYLADRPLCSIGNYERTLKRCNIDFAQIVEYWSEAGEECLTAYLACVIVHEATHGRIYSYGIPWIKSNWLRIEKLCRREEAFFAKRLTSYCEYSGLLVKPFDEEGLIAFCPSRAGIGYR